MKKKYTYFIMVVALIIFILLLLMLSPWLNIETIEVNGLKKVDQNQMIKDLELDKETNLLSFSKMKADYILTKNNYIESVKIKKVYPNKIIFNVKERELAGYVPYVNDYLYIDKNGFVVDIKPTYSEKLPIIKGLQFDNFTLGQTLKVENQDAFNIVMRFTNAIEGKEITSDILELNVSDLDDIHLYIGAIDVLLGNGDDIHIKINTLIEIMKKIPLDQKGFLDIKDIKSDPIFKLLT